MTRSLRFMITNTKFVILFFSCLSLTAIAPPQPPTAYPATNINNSSFTANWTQVRGATSYRLDVSTDIKFTTLVTGYANVSVEGTSLLVNGLSCDNTYYYRVRSVNTNGQSINSAVIAVQLCNRQ